MSKRFHYNNIFLYASLQFCGNIEEYFARHTKFLVVFLVLPRGSQKNIYRVYKRGLLVEETQLNSSTNIVGYYILWYKNYWKLLLQYFTKKENIVVISFHPLSFFFMSIQKLFRPITYVYWVGDFFPGNSPINIFYRHVAFFYNQRIHYRAYLSDRLNMKMNKDKIINTKNIKTIMWGIKNTVVKKNIHVAKSLTLGFVGVIRESQGIAFLLQLVASDVHINLKLLGPAPKMLANRYNEIIKKNNLEKRVYFPNTTLYGAALEKEIRTCDVGVAFYDEGIDTGTYYADPAKVKTYAQYGLPILMTNASNIAEYITKFHAGEVIFRDIDSGKKALERMRKNYTYYIQGLEKFAAYFDYELYYKEKFVFLENIESVA